MSDETFDASAWLSPAAEPEPVDELAILDTLEAISGSVEGLDSRLGATEATLGELTGAVEALMKDEPKKRHPRRYRFDTLDEAGQRALWLELADFVDYLNAIFGTSTYSSTQTWRIPDWWWKLPIVVFELTALKASHDEAFTSTTPKAPTAELIAWLDRWFWPCMHRIFNDKWGLKLKQPPDSPSTQFSVTPAVNDRTEFDGFLDADLPEEEDDGTAAVE